MLGYSNNEFAKGLGPTEEGAADAGDHGDHALVAWDLRLALAQEFEVGVVFVGPDIARFRFVKEW